MAHPQPDSASNPDRRPAWPPVDGQAAAWLEPRPPRPRANRAVIALVTVAGLLAIVSGVLAVLLVDARSQAADIAAAEVVEDRQEADDIAIGEGIVADTEQGVAELEEEAADAEARAEEAEAALSEAEDAAAPTDGDRAEFLRLLRGTDPAFGSVAGEDLVEFGEVTCDYLDAFGSSDQTIARLGSMGVESGLTARQTAAVTSAAIVELCPQHTLD